MTHRTSLNIAVSVDFVGHQKMRSKIKRRVKKLTKTTQCVKVYQLPLILENAYHNTHKFDWDFRQDDKINFWLIVMKLKWIRTMDFELSWIHLNHQFYSINNVWFSLIYYLLYWWSIESENWSVSRVHKNSNR